MEPIIKINNSSSDDLRNKKSIAYRTCYVTIYRVCVIVNLVGFFFSSRRRHTRFDCDWSSDVCSSDLKIPLKVTAGTGRVALRWPRSEVVRCLIEEFEGPVTGTSANISGFSSCASAAQVMKQLGSRVPLVLDAGETGATLPSTIVELNGDAWRIGREGAIAVEEIERAMKARG